MGWVELCPAVLKCVPVVVSLHRAAKEMAVASFAPAPLLAPSLDASDSEEDAEEPADGACAASGTSSGSLRLQFVSVCDHVVCTPHSVTVLDAAACGKASPAVRAPIEELTPSRLDKVCQVSRAACRRTRVTLVCRALYWCCLCQRQRQIDIGKATPGYAEYTLKISKYVPVPRPKRVC